MRKKIPLLLTVISVLTVVPASGATPSQPCPQALHDSWVTTGPDGKTYPTWHPAVDPTYGCFYGHEHGTDPRTSAANSSMPAFGYVGGLAGVSEPHAGFKVFTWYAGEASDKGPAAGRTSPAWPTPTSRSARPATTRGRVAATSRPSAATTCTRSGRTSTSRS